MDSSLLDLPIDNEYVLSLLASLIGADITWTFSALASALRHVKLFTNEMIQK
jgi:hypothetical protein